MGLQAVSWVLCLDSVRSLPGFSVFAPQDSLNFYSVSSSHSVCASTVGKKMQGLLVQQGFHAAFAVIVCFGEGL